MRIILSFFLTIIFKFCFSQDRFSLNGTVKNLQSETVFIEYQSIDSFVIDSSKIKNGRLAFSGNINGPTIATLKFTYNKQEHSSGNTKCHSVNIFLEEGSMAIRQDSKSTKLDDLEAHNFFESFLEKIKPLNKNYDILYKEYQVYAGKMDSAAMKQNEKERNELEKISKKHTGKNI